MPARALDDFSDAQRVVAVHRDTEQTHVVLGMRAIAALDSVSTSCQAAASG